MRWPCRGVGATTEGDGSVNGSAIVRSKRRRSHDAGLRPEKVLVLALLAVSTATSGPAAATNLMPTGDSITEGVGSTSGLGFRHILYTSLNTIGGFDFVGPSGTEPDEGDFFTGARIADYHAGGSHDIGPTIATYGPDIVAIHLGTAEVFAAPGPYGPWSSDHGTPDTNPTGDLGTLIGQALMAGSSQVIVSRIIPIQGRETDVADFNREVVRIALDYRHGTVTGSPEPVRIADHWTRFTANPNAANDWMFDAIHPNDAGYDQMKTVYFEAVDQALNDLTPPDPITDLAVGTVHGSSVLLVWTNTGDDGTSGTPRYADCRYGPAPIDAASFPLADQGGDYHALAAAGEVGGEVITGLSPATTYHFAAKLLDDAANLSAMSNPATVATTENDNIYEDAFTRSMSHPGPDWASTSYVVTGSELDNTAPGFATAIFTRVVNPFHVELTWGAGADAAGINQAGLACRLESTDPNTADGYIVYRNTAGDQTLALREVVDGVPGALIDTDSPRRPAPQAGDRFAVEMRSDANGHQFIIYVNGELDATLVDPLRRHGNNDYWCGVIGDGSFSNNAAAWRVEAVSFNGPPEPFDLIAPTSGSNLVNLNPLFDWESTTDPDGDYVFYDFFMSPDPDFQSEATLRVDNLIVSNFARGIPVAPNTMYYWRVKAQDPEGAATYSLSTRTFTSPDLHQIRDDFERSTLGPDWIADPSYAIVNGEIACTAPGFSDLAIYTGAANPVSVEWRWSEAASQTGIGYGGCLLGMDAPSTIANGYFVFRNTAGQQRWSVWEVQNGELTGSLNIDVPGLNPVPQPGDVVRVVFVRDASGHHFECYVDNRFDARMTDPERRQGSGSLTFVGLLLGENEANNIEEFTVAAAGLNLPPAAFNLQQPIDQSIVYSLAPLLRWEEAVDPNPGDLITYTVSVDTDPDFPNPQQLPSTTLPETMFREPLAAGETYYWRVQARDASGAQVMSNQSWTFVTAPVEVIVDDFNRPTLGPDWNGDLAPMQIIADELRNTSALPSFDLGIYEARPNPTAAGFRFSPGASPDGILRGGLAVMMDAASGSASGYLVTIDPFTNRSKLGEIRAGASGFPLTNAAGLIPNTLGAGGTWKVLLSSDPTGHHFDVYIGDDFHSRLTDPGKRQGNTATLYAGVGLVGQSANAVDDFMLIQSFGPAPGAFTLLSPAHADTGVVYQPTLTWRAAGPTSVLYVVYVGTDSTFAASDSVIAASDTTLAWPMPLAHNTDYAWRVRATDGQTSIFNQLGWNRFRTTAVSTVELAEFSARADMGAVILTWSTAAEADHLGFHVWRSELVDGSYGRLTGPQPISGRSPYTYRDPIPPGSTYYYRLEAVSRSGESVYYGPVAATALEVPLELALHPNVPNPFNPATVLSFDLPAAAEVRLVIFDIAGRAVREVAGGRYPAGRHAVTWDGRNRAGEGAGSGIYFARLTVGDVSRTRKLLLVK